MTVAHDGAGNLTADWAGRSFKYDGDNRMVTFDTSGTDDDTTYAYDGEGRRVRKVVGGSSGATTTYVYNVLGQLVAEYTGTVPGALRYLTSDHLGSTRVVTDSDGAAISRHDYLPFGEEIPGLGGRTPALKYSADGMSGPAQKFTGKERDGESRLDYFQARYFSGAGGRFTSVDPENAGADPADPQSWNGYAYARNNPLRFKDPDGRECISLDNGDIGDDGQGRFCDRVNEGDREEQNNPSVTVHTGSLSVYADAFAREMERRASASKTGIVVGASAGMAGGLLLAGGGGFLGASGIVGGSGGATGVWNYFARLITLNLVRVAPTLPHLLAPSGDKMRVMIRRHGGGLDNIGFMKFACVFREAAIRAGTQAQGFYIQAEAVIYRVGNSYLTVGKDGRLLSYVHGAIPSRGVVLRYKDLGGK